MSVECIGELEVIVSLSTFQYIIKI